ncbi:hypothetical protein Q5P01_003080 [Channa striata]|uniref:Uncharacterized protein n=1 Tax=Channa striata TaxID=64152 RepID=A0AA88NRP0_CHASR|nr:hypothetical protein Q5P01_003080 [Channa striata]
MAAVKEEDSTRHDQDQNKNEVKDENRDPDLLGDYTVEMNAENQDVGPRSSDPLVPAIPRSGFMGSRVKTASQRDQSHEDETRRPTEEQRDPNTNSVSSATKHCQSRHS